VSVIEVLLRWLLVYQGAGDLKVMPTVPSTTLKPPIKPPSNQRSARRRGPFPFPTYRSMGLKTDPSACRGEPPQPLKHMPGFIPPRLKEELRRKETAMMPTDPFSTLESGKELNLSAAVRSVSYRYDRTSTKTVQSASHRHPRKLLRETQVETCILRRLDEHFPHEDPPGHRWV
jgi:hypothetical protein